MFTLCPISLDQAKGVNPEGYTGAAKAQAVEGERKWEKQGN